MNDTPTEAEPVKKPPRKPRPSEIAAKLAKAAKKTKSRKPAATKKKVAKTKKPAKKTAIAKKRRGSKPAKKATKRTAGVIARPERLDMRLTKAERAKVVAVAKRTKRTITSVVYEAIAKLK